MISNTAKLAGELLGWYDLNSRILPWRAAPGVKANPYHVWLSEIMLQQTKVETIKPYFTNFIAKWPHFFALAAADQDTVLHAWQGLGYYARARNLLKCARIVVEKFNGRLPETEQELLELPGIGSYTAAAIASIAFEKKAVVVDGNVERVIARLFAVKAPLPKARQDLKKLAEKITPKQRPGDYAQAIMDLGATVCTPKNPDCIICPWGSSCEAKLKGIEIKLPSKTPKKKREGRFGVVFWIKAADETVFLRRRDDKGLLGGMFEFPSTQWLETPWTLSEAIAHAPIKANWMPILPRVKHSFTHFDLDLEVIMACVNVKRELEGVWCSPHSLDQYPLPTLMKKIAMVAIEC